MSAPATAQQWRELYFPVDRAASDPLEYRSQSSEAHLRRSPCDHICFRPGRHANARDSDTVYDPYLLVNFLRDSASVSAEEGGSTMGAEPAGAVAEGFDSEGGDELPRATST